MKKHIIVGVCLLISLTILPEQILAFEAAKKPPRPEKQVEEIPERPSEFHVWQEGRWKWKNKEQSWIWKPGSWSFDHDYYQYKRYNQFGRYSRLNRFTRSRIVAVPIGRGYYRLVRVY